MSIAFKAGVLLLTLGYPFIVYWGLQRFNAALLLPLLAMVLALRWLAGEQRSERKVIVASAIGVTLIAIIGGIQQGLKFYPVLVNFSMLVIFASSLYARQTVVEKMARLKEPDLSPQGVAYTRNVTQVWCAFFVFNGTVSAVTAVWASEQIWMLYNGFIAYILIGLLMVVEWVVRQRVKRN
ncbi:hypothetical protein Q4508_06775 [Amphritea sp. 2_MG-2023]|uniref:COG4648 family protein n=1 Tax=Amphritea TaxID=515417 RepID=UPI001C06D257|nr:MULTISPECIES: hypothetical protein [Amphritea]MBU2967483.1 hypothetical protein [Amphritea atlantica]MDO6418262.1 hypothetical protein [Amphritea sp. 2_MG-2023]MDX2424537.1 hypothetical protein [Amphritea sp.]